MTQREHKELQQLRFEHRIYRMALIALRETYLKFKEQGTDNIDDDILKAMVETALETNEADRLTMKMGGKLS